MNLEQTIEKLSNLAKRITGINRWINENPNTAPNVYEMMDCNIQLAEHIADLKKHYVSTGDIPSNLDEEMGIMATTNFLVAMHPEVEACYAAIGEMEILRKISQHPFFICDALEMYETVRNTQDFADYIAPDDEALRKIKRELLCKSMSVPFYIWQVHRTDPDYQYDNMTEFEGMKSMLALYQATETPCQFASQLDALFKEIDRNYKYKTPQQAQLTSKK